MTEIDKSKISSDGKVYDEIPIGPWQPCALKRVGEVPSTIKQMAKQVAKVTSDKAAVPLKQIIQGTAIAECGARQLMDSTSRGLKYKVKSLLSLAQAIQADIKRDCGDDSGFDRHYNGNEVVLVAELAVLIFGFSEKSLEELNSEIRRMIKEQTGEEPKM